ncbi:hypothetical protein AAE478_003013 [Parahypoxylon ruwenzoriense]
MSEQLSELHERLLNILKAIKERAVAFLAVIRWFGPRVAAAWDRPVLTTKTYEGDNRFYQVLVKAVKMAAYILSPFRLDDPGIVELMSRITQLEKDLAEERAGHDTAKDDAKKANARCIQVLRDNISHSDLMGTRFKEVESAMAVLKAEVPYLCG